MKTCIKKFAFTWTWNWREKYICTFTFKREWKNQRCCRTVIDVYHKNYVFSFYFASRLLNGTWMTSIKVRACRNVWGSIIHTHPQSLLYITSDSPGGTVLLLICYTWGTIATKACMDLKLGPCGFLFNFLASFLTSKIFL